MNPSLYRPYFTPAEIDLLDRSDRTDLISEINLLRVLLARVLEASRNAHELTLQQHAAILSAFSHAGLTMAHLLRTQAELHHPLDALWQAIAQGEHLARKRRGVYAYLSSGRPAS